MQSRTFSAMTSIVFLVLAGCATTEQSLRDRARSPLAHSELEALFSRIRTVRRTTAEGVSVTNTYLPNGTSLTESPRGSTEGTWQIKAGKFCTQNPFRDQGERCVTIYKTGDNEYKSFQVDGAFSSTFSFTN